MSNLTEEFLIEEYKELNNSLHLNEERGEKRLEFFITLCSLVIGIVGFAIKSILDIKVDPSKKNVFISTGNEDEFISLFCLMIIFFLSGLILIGIVILLRLDRRNNTTDGFKNDIKKIRELVKSSDDNTVNKILPHNYSAFTHSFARSKFTSLNTIAKIVTVVLIGTWFSFIALLFKFNIIVLNSVTYTAIAGFTISVIIFLIKKEYTHAGGIVYKEENGEKKFLIVTSLTDPTKWVLPKGHIEKHERSKFTAIRELLEEANILAMPIKKIGYIKFKTEKEDVNVVYYLMKYIRGIGDRFENREIRWLNKETALNQLSFKEGKKILSSTKV